MVIEFENVARHAKIKVVGVGGGGSNAVSRMFAAELAEVEFVVANTDLQALQASPVGCKLQLGSKLTGGLGAGGNPEVGRKAAEESMEEILETLDGADMIFVTAGMGGGTGTGGAPVVARLARELGALTVGVVTKPFMFEGRKRMRQAEAGISALQQEVDTLIVIPNQKLVSLVDQQTGLAEAFSMVDDVLLYAVQSIAELITGQGIINLDFADVKTVMQDGGRALMGVGVASGDNRALEAVKKAISSPLLEDASIDGARGILLNFAGSSDMKLSEIHEAACMIQENAHKDADIFFGAVKDEELQDKIKVTVIATGFERTQPQREEEKKPVHIPPQWDIGRARDFPPVFPAAGGSDGGGKNATTHVFDKNDLDVPTFLRNKMPD